MKRTKRLLALTLFIILALSAIMAAMAAQPVGTNLARVAGCTYSADYSESGREPALAFDGNRTGSNSRWAGGDSHSGNWLSVRFPAVEPVSSVAIYFEAMTKGANANNLAGTLVIQVSANGSEWTEVARQSTFTAGVKNVTLTFTPVYTQYVRVYFPETQFWLSIYEFEIYWSGESPGGDPTALRTAVAQCEPQYTDTVLSQYKMTVINRYKAALSEAKRILTLATPAQAEIDAALTELNAAIRTFSTSSNRILFTAALKAKPAEDWNELLNNLDNPGQDDWRAGDGLRSVPLNGVKAIGSGNENTPTVWLFSDSYITSYRDLSKSLHLNWLQMPNHVFAEFTGIQPDKSKLNYVYGEGGDKSKVRQAETDEGGISNVIPDAFWVQDGMVIGNDLYILFDHQNKALTTINTSMARIPILSGYKVDWANAKWLGYTDVWNSRTTMGVSLFDNSALSGVPANKTDDYVYIYGNTQSGSRRACVARVRKADFAEPNKWEYYTSGGWVAGSAGLGSVAIITPSNFMISAQHCVTYINSGIYEGKYMMTYTEGGISERMGYLLGDNPWGPFTNPTICYVAPQVEQYQNELYQVDNPRAWYVTYNVITHPHLSKPGELLVSYDCYVWDSTKWDSNTQYYDPNWHGTETNEFYRERFFTIDLTKLATLETQNSYTLVSQGKPVTASSGSNASYATDNNDKTKWEASGAGPYDLTVDLGKPMEIGRFIVKHGGLAIVNNTDLAARNYLNARKFQLQFSDDNTNWKIAVDKQYNANWQNDENINPVIARYWRLHIDMPTQGTMDKATIHEFQLYAVSHSISADTPGGVTVNLDKTTALYGDTVTFTVNEGYTISTYDTVALFTKSGALLQTLKPSAYYGVYTFAMPDKDVIVKLYKMESGIIGGGDDFDDSMYRYTFVIENDLVHVTAWTLSSVKKLALYENGGRIGIKQQFVANEGDTLKWDLWFKLEKGEHLIEFRGGLNAFLKSGISFKITI
jgi:hypothetical protein